MAAAPVAPAAGEFAVSLIAFLLFVVAFGLLWAWRHTLGAVLQAFAAWAAGVSVGASRIRIHPLRPISDIAVKLDHWVDHALSVAAENSQLVALKMFHQSAFLLAWLGQQVGGLAYDVSAAFERTATATIPDAITRATHTLFRRITAAEHAVDHALDVSIPSIQHRISTLDHARKSAEALAAREAATIAHDVTVTLPHEIAHAEAWIGRTAKQARAHARRLANIEALLTVAGVAALVNVALSTLKLNWIKCPALGRIGRKHGCAPWHLLEDMLGGTFLALAATDICKWSALMTGAAQEIRPVLVSVVGVENALVGCHGATGPPALTIAGYSPTPVVDAISF